MSSEETCNEARLSQFLQPIFLYCFFYEHSSPVTVKVKSQKQEPEEYVTIENLTFKKEDKYQILPKSVFIQTCTFRLNFQNNLHLMAPEYKYKVICKALVLENHARHHALLFEKTVVRKSSSMIINWDFYVSFGNALSEELIHICFEVERIKPKCIKNVTPEVDIGRMLLNSGMYHDVEFYVEGEVFKVHKPILALKLNLERLNDPDLLDYSSKIRLCCRPEGLREESKDDALKVFPLVIEDEEVKKTNSFMIWNDRYVKLAPSEYTPEGIQGMLSYIYTGKVEKILKLVIELLGLANKYGIPDLKSYCEEYLYFDLRAENALYTKHVAMCHGLENLKMKVIRYLDKLRKV